MEGPVASALASEGVHVVTVAHLAATQTIFDQVLRRIADADIVVAEVTEAYETVYYELGVANGLGKHAIVLTERPEQIAPHLRHYYAIPYSSAGAVDAQVGPRILGALHRIRVPSPIPTEFFIAPPPDHLLLETVRSDPEAGTALTTELVAMLRELGQPVVIDRVRTGSFFSWLRVGGTAARWGRKIQQRFSSAELRSAQAELARAEAERARAEADATRRQADRDDALAAINIYERLARLAQDPGAGPFSVTIGGETRIETDGEGRVRAVRPTPEQLGMPPDFPALRSGDDDPEHPPS